MATITVDSRTFNQQASAVKQAASERPVFITHRGEPSHVLMSIGEYRRLTRKRRNLVDILHLPEAADIELEIERSREPSRAAEFD